VSGIAGPDAVAAGAWLEAARIAADRRDEEFFRSPRSRAALAAVGRIAHGRDEAEVSAARLQAECSRSDLDYPALRAELERLLDQLAR
jgi:hypothetical protein